MPPHCGGSVVWYTTVAEEDQEDKSHDHVVQKVMPANLSQCTYVYSVSVPQDITPVDVQYMIVSYLFVSFAEYANCCRNVCHKCHRIIVGHFSDQSHW